ncbi:ATP-dependent Clp protease proteolytic subunit [Hibiscus syriacus]|uniref:ATP-dependent Clp protease proteolytic subunit n=1 Tax=Hibiscus syriacus TaxID=106335 RepID=A0A6A3CAT5_HIBSY|nr:ATP-dependent Clp protease proteolytic subunit [Hibiscus syriacus]
MVASALSSYLSLSLSTPTRPTSLSSLSPSYDAIQSKTRNPSVMPAVMTPGGPLDVSTVLFRNRIIFIGQPVNSQVAQRVISQLVTLAAIDEDADILVYLNCPGGSTYSVLAIYDCMSWIKPKVGTVCFGVAASQGALLLAGGEKGMRYAIPNARIMIHQPQSGCGGHVEDVRRQVNEAVQSRHILVLPSLTRTVKAISEVESFALRAEDLKFVAAQFRRLHSKQQRHKFRFYSHQWRAWAACFVQAAWCLFKKRKEAAELRVKENLMATEHEHEAEPKAPGSGLAKYAAKLAASTRRGVNMHRESGC